MAAKVDYLVTVADGTAEFQFPVWVYAPAQTVTKYPYELGERHDSYEWRRLSSNHDAMLITPKEFRGSILNMTPTSRIQTSYAYIIQRRLERVARFTHPFRGDPDIDSVLAMGLPNPTDRYLAEHPVIPRHPRKFRPSGWNPLPFPRLVFQPKGWSHRVPATRVSTPETRRPQQKIYIFLDHEIRSPSHR